MSEETKQAYQERQRNIRALDSMFDRPYTPEELEYDLKMEFEVMSHHRYIYKKIYRLCVMCLIAYVLGQAIYWLAN